MKYLIHLFIFLIITIITTTSQAQYMSINTGILPFFDYSEKNTSGKISDLVLSELSNVFSRYKFIKLIERSKLDEILKELELSQSGLIDERSGRFMEYRSW